MKDYYVSLVKDLLGCYIRFRADSSNAVVLYLRHTYLREGQWTLPWCSVYEELPKGEEGQIVLGSKSGNLYEVDFVS